MSFATGTSAYLQTTYAPATKQAKINEKERQKSTGF